MDNAIQFKKITACLDMAGCPNRCRHCWLGTAKNGNLTTSDLEYMAGQFRPFTEDLAVFSWYREPDYTNNYKELWQLENSLSDSRTPHYELMSFWRSVRDEDYVKWLYALGIRVCQLTLFGMERTTDAYIGRTGAFKEILRAIDLLLQNGIAPRLQIFITKNNISELSLLESLIEERNLEQRCAEIGQAFTLFVHQGSCDGENAQFYTDWITPEDIRKIPESIAAYTVRHFKKSAIEEVFGNTEKELYEALIADTSNASLVSDTPVFLVDRVFDVYPNISQLSAWWKLGNLKTDGVSQVVENYFHSRSTAQHTRLCIPICDMVKKCGNPDSLRLFSKDDYIAYLINRYCEKT